MKVAKIAKIALCVVMALAFSMGTPAYAVTAADIDAGVKISLDKLEKIDGGDTVINGAKGMLVFPSVFKAAIGFGGEYGEGALIEAGQTDGYYSTAAASFGLQLGGQKKTIIIAFMTDDALNNFKKSEGWKIGADASVAVIAIGAGTQISSAISNKPIVAFVFDEKGLMYDLSINGAKVTKITR
ncbi:MAG: lipid-binding SYLF domain-containing protein [Candidatus Omnitrophica bacterium]|nr:lipid-binding SYLF domain-containing protein [Candidatus Omnitrophota bacterium]MDD5488503.1 lipid-binding SYLF domain-containing protein [Candidatus Omnitrophota bacterium]